MREVPPNDDRGRAAGDERHALARAASLACIALAVVLSALAAGLTIAGSPAEYAWLEGVARGLMVWTPLAVGLYAAWRPATRRFGWLLVVAGLCWFMTTLSEASNPVAYATGRVFGWIVEPLLLYLVLTFPTGRLAGRVDRGLVITLALVVATLYLPTALLVERYPEPLPWSMCHAGCPANALMVVSSEPAFVEDVVRPLREVIVTLLFGAVAVRLAMRLRTSTPLMRRTLAPVLGAAVLRLVNYGAALVLRRFDDDSALLDAAAWSLALGVPLMAAAFLVGLARWRLFIATAMQRLAWRLAAHPRPEDLREALAEAFDDPSLEVVYWRAQQGVWVDDGGRLVRPPPAGSGRWLTEIRDGDRRIAGIVHDEALRDERGFIDTATAYAVMTIDNHRLAEEADALLAEVRDSRARIQAGADDERRRIERDLHDGAQQRLVALRIQLELAAERLEDADAGSADLFRRLGGQVDGALDEVRSLARGIYPAPLADRGLVEALRSAALQAALPTTVHATATIDRYPREIESAAYFCCLEALQNAAKHAEGATVVVIEVSDDGALRFEVRDDGGGFESAAAIPGVGFTSMRDRVAAVSGDLAVVSSPGRGTRVVGRIPLGGPAAGRPAARRTRS